MIRYPLHQPIVMATGEAAGAPRPRDGIHIDEAAGIAEVLIVDEAPPVFDAARERLEPTKSAQPMPFDANETKWVKGWTIVPLPLADVKASRLAAAHAQINAIRRAVVPPLESQDATYGLKLALVLQASHGAAAAKNAARAILTYEATATGETIDELVTSVIARGVPWAEANQTMEGMRRAFETAITAATTVAKLDAIADPDFAPIRTALGLPAT